MVYLDIFCDVSCKGYIVRDVLINSYIAHMSSVRTDVMLTMFHGLYIFFDVTITNTAIIH